MPKLDGLTIQVNLPFLSVQGAWSPNDAERAAAWALYVELMTRVSTQARPSGHVGPVFDSLYSIFPCTRDLLRQAGPGVAHGPLSLGPIAMDLLNLALRPFLDRFHHDFQLFMAHAPPGVPDIVHEDVWPRRHEFYNELAQLQAHLRAYGDLLAAAAGIRG